MLQQIFQKNKNYETAQIFFWHWNKTVFSDSFKLKILTAEKLVK